MLLSQKSVPWSLIQYFDFTLGGCIAEDPRKCSVEWPSYWPVLNRHVLNGHWINTGFTQLMQCPFKTCKFRMGQLLGRWYCCLQLSQEPLIQTTSHWTLHFLGSSAIHPPSVKSIRWTVFEIIEGQTDRQRCNNCAFEILNHHFAPSLTS